MEQFLTLQQASFPDFPPELIEGCRNGDQKAQLQVYKLCYKPVYKACIILTGDPGLAEEMMQDSFIRAFENIHSYPGDISFPVWIKEHIKIR